jgi:hypothetical protein
MAKPACKASAAAAETAAVTAARANKLLEGSQRYAGAYGSYGGNHATLLGLRGHVAGAFKCAG